MEKENGLKFAFIALSETYIEINKNIKIGDFSFYKEIPNEIKIALSSGDFEKWNGSIMYDSLVSAKVCFLISKPSNTYNILNSEDEELKSKLEILFNSIKLSLNFPAYTRAIYIAGNSQNGSYCVRRWGDYPIDKKYIDSNLIEITDIEAEQINSVYESIRNIYSDENVKNEYFLRPRLGFVSLINSLQSQNGTDAMLQLCKSIEALTAATNSKEFAKKCLKILNGFNFTQEYSEEQLKEIYILRGRCVHLNLEDIHRHFPEKKIEETIKNAFIISKFLYKKLLLNENEINKFKDLKGLKSFYME